MIPFNRPYYTGREDKHLREVFESHKLSGDGKKTAQCHALLESLTGAPKALLVHSGTAALEMAALICDLKPGDEVIMPSFTFVSTANAIVLRGAVPVFVDIRPDTLNIDETKIEAAITPKTRAILPVHYAGVICAMDEINAIAKKHRLLVIEDSAQAIGSTYKGKSTGTLSDFSCLSFHDTKNVIAGEGGALLLKEEAHILRAEIIREKGTNRKQFLRGQVDKYSWTDIGSSFLPSELNAAVLLAQLEDLSTITTRRKSIWESYYNSLSRLESAEKLKRPTIPTECSHNGHIFYVLLPTEEQRNQSLKFLNENGVQATFHYVPLHPTGPGKKYGRTHGSLKNTTELSAQILRLPLWIGVEEHQERILDLLEKSLKK